MCPTRKVVTPQPLDRVMFRNVLVFPQSRVVAGRINEVPVLVPVGAQALK